MAALSSKVSFGTIAFPLMALLMALAAQGCYYDVEEELYGAQSCDTSNVTYVTKVESIINFNCINCHSGSNPSGNILLDSYDALKTQANKGALIGSINHEVGFSPMPKNGNKLSACDRKIIQIWIDSNMP